MKKNKIIKRTVKPKNNYFKYAAMVLLVVFAAVGVGQILGFEINKDTTVCKDKKGNLFVPLDKEGKTDSCGKHDGEVAFNFDGGSGGSTGSGVVGIDGGIVYMFDSTNGPIVLKKGLGANNEVVIKYYYFNKVVGVPGWAEDIELSQKMEVTLFDNIFQWFGRSLITQDGEVYFFKNGSWEPEVLPTQ